MKPAKNKKMKFPKFSKNLESTFRQEQLDWEYQKEKNKVQELMVIEIQTKGFIRGSLL